MSKTIYITTEQLRYFSELSEKEGKCIVKHLPESSAFKPKDGSWKTYWESKSKISWPTNKNRERYTSLHLKLTKHANLRAGHLLICCA